MERRWDESGSGFRMRREKEKGSGWKWARDEEGTE
jgi:hypothetical protein